MGRDFFQKLSNPIFGVTFSLDVTRLHAYAKAHGISFYYALVFLCTEAINSVEAFHYCERADGLFRLERRIPSFTDLKPGAYYLEAVAWATSTAVTMGMTDTTFAPNAPCTRAQAVTFLMRADALK